MFHQQFDAPVNEAPLTTESRAAPLGRRVAGRHLLALGVVGALLVAALAWSLAGRDQALLRWSAPEQDGLVTNEYAYFNPEAPDAVRSPDWEMTSGSLFARGGVGWSGRPSAGGVDALSSTETNSAVFRLNTRRHDFGDVALRMRLRVLGQNEPDRADPQWDGVHLWVRHVNEEKLYVASVMRRDGHVVLKRKLPGGPSNGGTYTTLAETQRPLEPGQWHDVEARARTLPEGGVRLSIIVDGTLALTADDHGQTTDGKGGATPITEPGAVGLRADNTEVEIDDVTVTPCTSDAVDECQP